MFICSIAILSHQFPDGRARGRAFAAWGVVAGIGLGFGPVMGGAIVSLATWQWVFLVHAPLALLGLALIRARRGGVARSAGPPAASWTWRASHAVRRGARPPALITQGAGLGWTSPAALGLLAAGRWRAWWRSSRVERTHPHLMFDFSVFRIRGFSGAILGCIGMNCSYWPFMIYLPLYFSAGLGLRHGHHRADAAGLHGALPRDAAHRAVAAALPGTRRDSRGGLGRSAWASSLMRWGTGHAHRRLDGAARCSLAGIGLGLTTTPATNMTTASVPAHRAGMASGMDVSARLIALALNIAVMGPGAGGGHRRGAGHGTRGPHCRARPCAPWRNSWPAAT